MCFQVPVARCRFRCGTLRAFLRESATLSSALRSLLAGRCRPCARLPNPIQIIDAGHAQTARRIVKAVKVNERQPHAQQNTFAFFDEAVNSNQCKHQKRQIIDEHQLKMRVKKAACRHIKHAAGKRRPSSCRVLLVVSPQPYVDHITAEQKLKYRITAEDVFHPNTRKQVSQQNIRPQQPIIGEVIDRYTPAQIYI